MRSQLCFSLPIPPHAFLTHYSYEVEVVLLILHHTLVTSLQGNVQPLGGEINHQAPVVQRVSNAIHWINLYLLDSAVHLVNTNLLDSNLSSG